jgi:hypothetical protein
MPTKKATKRKNSQALKRWARYRAEQAEAEERGKAIVEKANFRKSADRLWAAKSGVGGRKITKAGFRTKKGAKQWLEAQARAFVRSRKAKALSTLPSKEKTIAKAFEQLEEGEVG